MKYVIAFGLAILVVLASAAAYVYYGLTHRPDLSSFVALTAAPDINRNAPLRVTFLGVSTLLFDDGSTAILLDGFFTRVGEEVLGGLLLRAPVLASLVVGLLPLRLELRRTDPGR